MAAPTLIYCANGNRRFADIAIRAGYEYGAQLPGTVYFPVVFADQDFDRYQKALATNPEKAKSLRAAYMKALSIHKPRMASVYDWMEASQFDEVMDWAEEAAQYVETVMIIPKVQGGIKQIPRHINGKDVRLGYSVPTRHGGTELPLWDFAGWPVHLLGGSPHAQMNIYLHLRGIADVATVDGNMTNRMAHYCRFWREKKGEKGHWVNMYETGDRDWGKDSNYEAFRRSCVNIKRAWEKILGRIE